MNFSRKKICVLIALNQDIRKRIVKIILNVIIVRGITTQPFVIKGVQRNTTQLPQRDNKGSKTTHQNQIQHEDGESQKNLPHSNLEEKLSCLVEGNTFNT